MNIIFPKEIILCSGNKGKIKEFNKAGETLGIKFKAISEIINEEFDPEETEDSFHGNALLKARAGAKLTNGFCLADDSGIEIDAFSKRPGIYSGRFLKKPSAEFLNQGIFDFSQKLNSEYPKDHSEALKTVINEIKNHEVKTCRFVCCLVLVNEKGEEVFSTIQNWEGKISDSIKGVNGFGYDPIVLPNEYPDKTIAELDSELKAKLSHRAKAIRELIRHCEGRSNPGTNS